MPLKPSQQAPEAMRQGVGSKAGEACSQWEAEGIWGAQGGQWGWREGHRAGRLKRRGKVGLVRAAEAGPQEACVVFQKPS